MCLLRVTCSAVQRICKSSSRITFFKSQLREFFISHRRVLSKHVKPFGEQFQSVFLPGAELRWNSRCNNSLGTRDKTARHRNRFRLVAIFSRPWVHVRLLLRFFSGYPILLHILLVKVDFRSQYIRATR